MIYFKGQNKMTLQYYKLPLVYLILYILAIGRRKSFVLLEQRVHHDSYRREFHDYFTNNVSGSLPYF